MWDTTGLLNPSMGTADTCVLGDQPTFCPGWKATCWRPELPGALRTSLGCSWQDASLEATKGWGAAPSSSSAWGSEGGAAPGAPNTRAPRRDRLPRRRDRTLAMLLPFLGRQRRHRVLYLVSGESGRCPPHSQSPWVSMKNDESFLSNFYNGFPSTKAKHLLRGGHWEHPDKQKNKSLKKRLPRGTPVSWTVFQAFFYTTVYILAFLKKQHHGLVNREFSLILCRLYCIINCYSTKTLLGDTAVFS